MYLFPFFRECPLNKYQINDKRACINLALGSIQEKYINLHIENDFIQKITQVKDLYSRFTI